MRSVSLTSGFYKEINSNIVFLLLLSFRTITSKTIQSAFRAKVYSTEQFHQAVFRSFAILVFFRRESSISAPAYILGGGVD